MADREKVIKGLETCYCPPSKCEVCPYNDLPSWGCNNALCLDALKLLKEQEPIIIPMDEIDEIYSYIAVCPKCKMTWTMWRPDRMRYCPGCGKAMKWDEMETI